MLAVERKEIKKIYFYNVGYLNILRSEIIFPAFALKSTCI